MDLPQFMYHSIYYMYIIQTSFRGTIDLLKLIVQEVPSSLSPSGVLPLVPTSGGRVSPTMLYH